MTNDALKELAPHGWKLTYTDPRGDPPVLRLGGKYYIPVKPKPREWEGTVGSLNGLGAPGDWDKYTVVKVVEVL